MIQTPAAFSTTASTYCPLEPGLEAQPNACGSCLCKDTVKLRSPQEQLSPGVSSGRLKRAPISTEEHASFSQKKGMLMEKLKTVYEAALPRLKKSRLNNQIKI